MIELIDRFLNRTTMYRVVLYYLLALWLAALAFGYFGWLPYQPLALVLTTAFILAVSLAANAIFRHVFQAHANAESVYITAFILALIITPPRLAPFDWSALPLLAWASLWATASKYIFAIGKKHLFNPAAFAVALTAATLNLSASWWVGGNLPLLPLVLLGGVLVVRKLKRADLVYAFLIGAAFSIIATTWSRQNPWLALEQGALHSPIFFFAFVMLTEPLTTPPSRFLRVCYGALVGLAFAPGVHVGSVYSTPELALLLGNAYSYLVSPTWKQVLTLVQRTKLGGNVYDFVFTANRRLDFKPGQYLEWTLRQGNTDSRGNRRYFTLASSPTEDTLRLGVKFYPNPSSFKLALSKLRAGDTVAAGQLAGDFTLPRNREKKLVFIAGGIGITPFRSMAKYLTDKNEQRSITLLYACKHADEFAYTNVFEEAQNKIGLRPIYLLTDPAGAPANWDGRVGSLNAEFIQQEVPDYPERLFYISGPHTLVAAFQNTLLGLGVARHRIKTDFFPGFA